MATHKSAEKRARQALKRNACNTQTLNSVRTFEKKVRTAIAANDSTGALEALKAFASKVDKAAAKGVVHAKNASRKISRLNLRIQKIGQTASK